MRNVVKLFSLYMLLTLSIMAIGATAAQAENEWLIGSPLKTFTEAGVTEKVITAEIAKGFLLNETLSITCPGGKETEISGVVKKGGTGSAKALFKGCKIFGSETHCTIYDELSTPGDPVTLAGAGMISASAAVKLFKHPKESGEHFILVEGLGATKAFSLFDIGGDALCPLGTNEEPFHFELTGSTVVKLTDPLVGQAAHGGSTLTLPALKELFPYDNLTLGENEFHFSAKSAKEVEGGIITTVRLSSGEVWGSN